MPDGPLPPEVIAEFLERNRLERLAAGLPEYVEDEVVLERIVSIMRSGDARRP